jgi:UDPglucose--hexose-1-phosphate uridylyltransferase
MPLRTSSFLLDQPHRRFNALTGEWIFVSPHRNRRPWEGRVEPPSAAARPLYDPQCYLCPGNARANGESNPPYGSTYVFTNDYPAFRPETHEQEAVQHPLLQAHVHAGTCRVMCFSPRHDLTLAQMPAVQIRSVVDTWADQFEGLAQRWRWVQLFENKGELMGCSNAHPHGQIWASDFIPTEPAKELTQQQRWFELNHAPLLLEYAALECAAGERLAVQNAHWTAIVPWWATWPFETLLLPRRHVPNLPQLTSTERDSLADILSCLLTGYDNLFGISFPYSCGWHGAPTGGHDAAISAAACQLHAHFYPPLLRSATVRKFMVGYEMLAEAQRDLTPEQAAERLRHAIAQRS